MKEIIDKKMYIFYSKEKIIIVVIKIYLKL